MKRIAAVLTLFAVSMMGNLFAQTYQGRILGQVSDSSGAVLPGARVTITNIATSVTRVLTTTSSGDYAAPNLEPGPYTVAIEAAGFRKFERTGLQLEVARDIRVDASLRPAAGGRVARSLRGRGCRREGRG